MKKQTLFGIIFVAALMALSMVLTPSVFAADVTHTVSIVNQSDTDLQPSNSPHIVVYNSTNTSCAKVPPDTCSQKNLTYPASIGKGTTGTVNIVGPSGCNISMWQTYWKPGKAGSLGNIQCAKTAVNTCNSVTKNYTCTITQANVNTAKQGTSVAPTVQ